jgi:hypothetical protein
MMETIAEIFSHLCGRGSCLVAADRTLPVCQRCLGLYVGAALTGAWILASGLWRRGLPSWGVFLVHEVLLLAAMLGGAHVWGAWPEAKLTCGLWTGHVALLWLIGGSGHLLRLAHADRPSQRPWRPWDKVQALAAAAAITALGQLIPQAMWLGWRAWTALAALGALVLAAGAAVGALSLGVWLAASVRRLRPRRHPRRA